MTHLLPKKPDLNLLKKQAKKLLKHYRFPTEQTVQQQAFAFIQQHHPKPELFNSLRDAQLTVARSYGFQDWLELNHGVDAALMKLESLEEQVKKFIGLACTQYTGNDAVGNYRRANRLLSQNPELSTSDFYAALVANRADTVATFLKQNKSLATQVGGPLNWPPLLYVTYSRIDDSSTESQAVKTAQHLIDHGADVNSFVILNDFYRFTALTGAMGEGEGGQIHQPPHQYANQLSHLLLSAGANPNESQGLYNTMFASNGLNWLKLLIDYGLHAEHQVNWKQENGPQSNFDFLIAYAVKHGFEERVDFLLNQGANPDTVDTYDNRRIYGLALIRGFPLIADKLLKHGAQTESLSTEDKLKQAIATNNTRDIDKIISTNPKFVTRADFIHHAALRGDFSTVLHLISLGFDVNGISNDGRSLLHVYAWEDDTQALDALIEAGADIDCKDKAHQSTPLGHALYSQVSNAIENLLNRTSNIIEVVCCAHLGRLKTLLTERPDLLHTRTPRGNTLMHIVGISLEGELAEQRSSELIDQLLTLGMDVNILNEQGSTPLDFALEIGNELLADILKERGGRLSSV